jgi:hypothetical protein
MKWKSRRNKMKTKKRSDYFVGMDESDSDWGDVIIGLFVIACVIWAICA